MKVDSQLVERLASLAKLSFSKEEKERLVKDLERMIVFVDMLLRSWTFPMKNRLFRYMMLRDASVLMRKGNPSERRRLRSAPSHDGTYFKVPKVIKEQ